MQEDLLIELGTEELPPTALANLSKHFSSYIQEQLNELGLGYSKVKSFASPRRLGLLISALEPKQADQTIERKGPNIKAAFDADGNPTKAGEGFARSCNTTFDQLTQVETDKGTCLAFSMTKEGRTVNEIIPELIQTSLDKLPIPKRMRWGDLDVQFVRPAHWLVVLYGQDVIDCEILSIKSSNITYGHRFHHPEAIVIQKPEQYENLLLEKGYVIADYNNRQEKIVAQINTAAEEVMGHAVISQDLLDEVTSMVEWPKAVVGSFDDEFLSVPAEALISSMKKHQKYFHLLSQDNENEQRLLPQFITISNIDSLDETQVKEGNERVIRPRLSDAMFFWQQDLKTPIQTHLDGLSKVIFQQKLGSIEDKCLRIEELSIVLAKQLTINVDDCQTASKQCKADLMSEMVGEFPDLQGIMGRYYAVHRGETDNVSIALDEYYLPRFSGDRTSKNSVAQVVGIADRIDTLCGIFAIGSPPTGDKDPFALRRAALGLIRIIVENNLDVDLTDLIHQSLALYPVDIFKADKEETANQILNFILERFKGYLLEQTEYNAQIFESVRSINISHLVDFIERMDAVVSFLKLNESEALAASNKRIANILKKAECETFSIDESLLKIDAEKSLFERYNQMQNELASLKQSKDYSAYLHVLTKLKEPIDTFFDEVMVFDQDVNLKNTNIDEHYDSSRIKEIMYCNKDMTSGKLSLCLQENKEHIKLEFENDKLKSTYYL
ncbi:MAG: glycine--tRNA ligase subunit beta, partial [Gammaproteobacteria bacterium]|nr:glycine--tRNA ligase subunit beta [Gammaproteobacteria bacterium]